MTDRKKPGVAFWATVVGVAALVGYPLSFGPACWLAFNVSERFVPVFEIVYAPLAFLADSTEPTKQALTWYHRLWFDERRLR
jgi:hypothetical protein